MAAAWAIVWIAANLALALLGPGLESSLPKSRAAVRGDDKGLIYSTNMEGIFRSSLLSLPKQPGEKRVIFSGNSAVAPPRLADALQASLASRDPRVQVSGLAWPGLPATGQLLFLRRGLAEKPDCVLWMISLVDCQWSPNIAGAAPGEERLAYCAGIPAALRNLRYASRDNMVAITHDFVAQACPYVRYQWALRHSLPALPSLDPGQAASAVEEGGDYRPPSRVAYPSERFRPGTAVACIESLYRDLPKGASLVLVVMPHRDPDEWFGPGCFAAYKSALRAWAAPHGVPVIDLSDTLPPEAFHDMVHYGRKWCTTVAEALAAQLPPAATGAEAP
jgi:hypothetical protein